MKLRFPEACILEWASKYTYQRDEQSLIDIDPIIKKAGFLTKAQLRQVAKWKSPRSAGRIEKNNEEYIREITSMSFSAKTERGRIAILTLLDGIEWPSASVILHFFHKLEYPILDFRALWSVNENAPSQYSFDFWWVYVEYCRELAQRNHVNMRTLDRALWQYSKENQGELQGSLKPRTSV